MPPSGFQICIRSRSGRGEVRNLKGKEGGEQYSFEVCWSSVLICLWSPALKSWRVFSFNQLDGEKVLYIGRKGVTINGDKQTYMLKVRHAPHHSQSRFLALPVLEHQYLFFDEQQAFRARGWGVEFPIRNGLTKKSGKKIAYRSSTGCLCSSWMVPIQIIAFLPPLWI